MLRTRTVIYKTVFNITAGGLDRFSQSRSRKAIIERLTNHSALIAYAYVLNSVMYMYSTREPDGAVNYYSYIYK